MRDIGVSGGSHNKVIELGLRPGMSELRLEALREVLDVGLSTVATLAAGRGGEAQIAAFRDRIERCRTTVASADARTATASAMECFASCAQLVPPAKDADRRPDEIVALIRLVRDAVEALAGGAARADAGINESTARLETLGRTASPDVLRAQLAIEVALLKSLAVERKRAWDETIDRFNTQVMSLEQELVQARVAATTDPLTRLANRRAFERACQEMLAHPLPQFVLAVLDIDHFKGLNDRHGHGAGDRLLVSVAQRIQASLRGSDVVGRLGGDEFGILAAGITLKQAESRLWSVAKAIADAPIDGGAGQRITVTVSCGVAEYSAGDSAQTLMERADNALYEAKRAGRNRVNVREAALIRDLMARRRR